MKRSTPLLALLVALLVALPASASASPAARHRPKPTCVTAGTTVVANGRVRVYARSKQVDATDDDFRSPAYFVCWKPRHRKLFLGWKADCTYPGGTARTFRLRRRALAYGVGACDPNSPAAERLVVLDVKTRSRKAQIPVTYLRDLVLTDGGGVAWIDERFSPVFEPDPSTLAVRLITCRAGTVGCSGTGTPPFDTGAGIEPGSLAAAGRWLYWTNAGVPRSHLLPPQSEHG